MLSYVLPVSLMQSPKVSKKNKGESTVQKDFGTTILQKNLTN
jgi:hypothetical protein